MGTVGFVLFRCDDWYAPYLDSITIKPSGSFHLAQCFCVMYFQMKKSNQETELGSSKTFPIFFLIIVYGLLYPVPPTSFLPSTGLLVNLTLQSKSYWSLVLTKTRIYCSESFAVVVTKHLLCDHRL